MYKVITYSNRLYLDENTINENNAVQIENNIVEFDRILFAVYNLCLTEVLDKEKYNKILGINTLFTYVKNKYNLNTYYANSIIRLAQGKVDSQKELQKEYIKNVQVKIDTKKSAIKRKENYIKNLYTLLNRINAYRIKCKQGKKAKLTGVRGITNVKIEDNVVYVKIKKKWVEYSLSKLEYEYIYPQLRKSKSLLGEYKHRLQNLEMKLKRLQTLKFIIFGTKDYMKEYSKGRHSKLRFLQHKYRSYEISGRCDFPTGNRMICPEYDTATDTVRFKLTLLNGNIIYLNNMKFKYRQKELIEAMYFDRNKGKSKAKKDGIPISCRITRHLDEQNRYYYQIGTIFDMETIHPYINYSTVTGIIGIDTNIGHIDLTELDAKGNLVNYKTYEYELTDNKEMNIRILNKIVDEIGQYAKSVGKIIAIEDLSLTELKNNFNKDKTNQRVINKYIHYFPYRRFIDRINYMKIKYGFDVIIVNPAYTSVIGELKYAYEMKLNTHIAASYVIGRRALGFKDCPRAEQNKKLSAIRPLKEYKSNWSMWAELYKMKTA